MIRICVQGSCSRAARTDSALCTDHDARPPQAPGVKHDAEKERWDLLPLDAATEVVRVLTVGAAKYAPDNWRKVPEARRRYLAAAWRHIVAWARGETRDPETGLHHLAHAVCCLMFLIELDTEA